MPSGRKRRTPPTNCLPAAIQKILSLKRKMLKNFLWGEKSGPLAEGNKLQDSCISVTGKINHSCLSGFSSLSPECYRHVRSVRESVALMLAHGPVQTPSIGFNYDILPPTTAITDYAIGVEILLVFQSLALKWK